MALGHEADLELSLVHSHRDARMAFVQLGSAIRDYLGSVFRAVQGSWQGGSPKFCGVFGVSMMGFAYWYIGFMSVAQVFENCVDALAWVHRG